ncbi:hypothetical protein Zmor_024696 [Zophobas morio]|uniref:Uncharacterized protein n=1 Tax=Zophobas morio TaxID=2755281 RepID=A0AA38I1B4_9CUCU|nr:hypothetical protein Zmor_024696 [Zophobas morio]
MLLGKNSKAHIAVLYKHYESLQKYDDKILTDKDEGGRSVLHFMSSWGKRHPRLRVTCEEREECQEYTVQEDSNFDGKAETEVYFVTLEHLLTKINVDDKDLLLEETPLSYAIRSESLGAELKLLQTKKNECNQLNVSNDTVNIIYYSTLLGYDGVFKLFIAEQLKNFWDKAKIVIARDLETPQSLAHYIVRNYPVDTAEQNRYEQLIEYFKQIKCIDDTEQSGTSLYKFPKRMRKN